MNRDASLGTRPAEGAPSTPSTLRGIAALDELFQPFNRCDAPGLVVGVALEGRTVYRRAFGLASVQHGVANTPQTRMRIGSTSKHFTCLAALLLAEEGKLDIDAPVSSYFPELPSLLGVPTLRQFMNHTSGYRCSLDMSSVANGQALQPNGWTLAALARQREANFAPGQGQMYNNGGYHLLSIAIERAAGIPFEQFLKERVFEPLGMHDTDSVPSDQVIVPGVAALHVPTPDGRWRRGFFSTEEVRGEGAMISTVDDMLRWIAHLNGPKRVGSETTWRQLMEPARLANGLVSVYSLGLNRHRYRGIEVIQHAGGVIGGNSQMLTAPAHGLDIAIMVNGAPASAIELAKRVVDAMLADAIEEPVPQQPAAGRFQHLVGTRYHGPSGMLVGFAEVGDRLGLVFMNNGPLPILRDEGERIFVGFEDVALGPLEIRTADLAARPDGSAPDVLPFAQSGYVEELVRIKEAAPDTSVIARHLTGRYWSHDLAASAEIAAQDGNLVLKLRGDYSGTRTLQVTPYSRRACGLADAEIPGYALAMTVDDSAAPAPGFQIDSIRARRLRFERLSDS